MLFDALKHSPSNNFLLHEIVFYGFLVVTLLAFIAWRIQKKRQTEWGGYWGMLAGGMFFVAVSEYGDLFTALLKTNVGLHNYLSELVLTVGLSMTTIALLYLVKG